VQAADFVAGVLRAASVRAAGALAFGGVLALALAQPLTADVRSASVLGQTDTRAVAREFLVERLRPAARVVIEPAVPGRYYRRLSARGLTARERKQFVGGYVKENAESRVDYARTLAPETIDLYRRDGFCTVVTMSLLRGRAERDRSRRALAYYRRLERESRQLLALDPYWPGAAPVRFHFDLSYSYYSPSFQRPGPAIRIYRLSDCRQGYGPVRGVGTRAPETAS
jgi:hypothetical protein